jgi:hypothetical protein
MNSRREPKDRFDRIQIWLGVLYALFPILLLALALTDRSAPPYLLTVGVVLVYLTAVVSIQFTLGFWPCPHCGKPFFGGWRMPAMIRWFSRANRSCANCGSPWRRDSAPSGRAA